MAQQSLLETDELSKNFVNAMRILFRIMDDQNTGFIQYSDIEVLWQDGGNEGLPRGILEALKQVTPPNGLLSFDRFCAGLKICLLRIKNELNSQSLHGNNANHHSNKPSTSSLIIMDNNNQKDYFWNPSNTAAIRPNNAILKRAFNVPYLNSNNHHSNSNNGSNSSSNNGNSNSGNNSSSNSNPLRVDLHKDYGSNNVPFVDSIAADERLAASKLINMRIGPPKPPRTNVIEKRCIQTTDNSYDKVDLRTSNNCQLVMMPGAMSGDDKCSDDKNNKLSKGNFNSKSTGLLKTAGIGSNDGNLNAQINQFGIHQHGKKKIGSSRGKELRRHTLQNGIDYNMIKKIKQIEQEKDILLQGLTAVEKAKEWYLKQIASTQEKIKHLSGMASYGEQWTETQQERFELQRARVLEVNRYLAALTSSWEKGGLPLHMNLAFLNTSNSLQLNQQQNTHYTQLQNQNYRLVEELNKKNHKIALLEEEKENLIRELYSRQAAMIQTRRSTMIHEQHDQTFII